MQPPKETLLKKSGWILMRTVIFLVFLHTVSPLPSLQVQCSLENQQHQSHSSYENQPPGGTRREGRKGGRKLEGKGRRKGGKQ